MNFRALPDAGAERIFTRDDTAGDTRQRWKDETMRNNTKSRWRKFIISSGLHDETKLQMLVLIEYAKTMGDGSLVVDPDRAAAALGVSRDAMDGALFSADTAGFLICPDYTGDGTAIFDAGTLGEMEHAQRKAAAKAA
jgi:hypothetical protein